MVCDYYTQSELVIKFIDEKGAMCKTRTNRYLQKIGYIVFKMKILMMNQKLNQKNIVKNWKYVQKEIHMKKCYLKIKAICKRIKNDLSKNG